MTTRASAAANSGLPSDRPTLSSAALAALIASTKAKRPTDHPDSALLALHEPYRRTFAALSVACDRQEKAEMRFFALTEERPDLDESSLRKAAGLNAAKRASAKAVKANVKITEEIFATPARTIEGLIFKARVSENESHEDDFLESIAADLLAMGKNDG